MKRVGFLGSERRATSQVRGKICDCKARRGPLEVRRKMSSTGRKEFYSNFPIFLVKSKNCLLVFHGEGRTVSKFESVDSRPKSLFSRGHSDGLPVTKDT